MLVWSLNFVAVELYTSYRISGNQFSAYIKGSRGKISHSKSFVLWTFCENLTRGETIEVEYGSEWCIHGYHFYLEIWEAVAGKILQHDGRHTCQFWPEKSDYTAHFAHVSY